MNNRELVNVLNNLPGRYILAIWTYKADFVDKIDDIENLLEVRAFDKSGEFRAYRSVIGTEFKCREIFNEKPGNAYDENHYLDIDDSKKTNKENGYILRFTTGGGSFHMPKSVNEKMLVVRYYYEFDDNGIARKNDWRLVGFSSEEVY
jgi:hypothetical protein